MFRGSSQSFQAESEDPLNLFSQAFPVEGAENQEQMAAPAASQDPARVDFASVMSAAEPVRIGVPVTDQHLAQFEPTTYPEGVSIPHTVTSAGIRKMAVFF